MTAPQLILHIGRHKSGTSSLQSYLTGARAHLDRQGVLYPRAGCGTGLAHHDIAVQCHPVQSDGAALNGIAKAIRAELEPHHDRILLSSEAFQNLPDLTRLQGFARALGAGDIRVLCYVREHLDYAMSGYRQMVQNQPRFVPFHKYLRGLGDMAPFVARWRDLGDLTLGWYDRSVLKDADIIADVCARLDIDPGEIPQGDKNPSIGGNLLAYKLAVNKLELPGHPPPAYRILRDLALEHAPFRAGFHIADADAARLRAQSVYNASLAAILGPPPRIRSWADSPVLPQADTLEQDMQRICAAATPGVPPPRRLIKVIPRAGRWLRPFFTPAGGAP